MWAEKELAQIGIFAFDILIAFLLVETGELIIIKNINRLMGVKK